MKQNLLKLFAAALTVTAVVTAKADYITYDNNTRQYLKYLPEDLGENRPLLISMHGMNQDAAYQKGMLAIESIADTAKFLTVFPEGIDRSWDIGGVRDINFVVALIDEMERLYHIDRNRVYLSGFSMGGMFTYHAMNYIADKIAAFAPISGYPMGGQEFTSSRPVPIIHTHGTSDDVVGFDGVQRSIDGWIERNGCSPTAYVTESYRGNGVTKHQWGPGDEGAEVVLIERANKGHWIANDPFSSGEEIWNFCKKYSLNAQGPSVNITAPTAGTVISGVGTLKGFSVKVNATAESEVSQIETVSLYGDNKLVATLTEAPYEFEWNDLDAGSHRVVVEATDARGVSVSRGFPLTIKGLRNSMSFSSTFKENVMPEGWYASDGRSERIGTGQECTGGPRAIKFTGDPRDMEYGLYTRNTTGGEDKGLVAYGDPRGLSMLMLTPGTYDFKFTTCNYNVPDCSPIRCRIIDFDTEELLAETTINTTTNIGNAPSNPFTGADNVVMTFSTTDRNTFVKIHFLADNVRAADLVVGNISLRKVSSDGIQDVEMSDAEVESVTYYDLQGRQLSNPNNGIVIRRMQMSNGNVKVDKISR